MLRINFFYKTDISDFSYSENLQNDAVLSLRTYLLNDPRRIGPIIISLPADKDESCCENNNASNTQRYCDDDQH